MLSTLAHVTSPHVITLAHIYGWMKYGFSKMVTNKREQTFFFADNKASPLKRKVAKVRTRLSNTKRVSRSAAVD